MEIKREHKYEGQNFINPDNFSYIHSLSTKGMQVYAMKEIGWHGWILFRVGGRGFKKIYLLMELPFSGNEISRCYSMRTRRKMSWVILRCNKFLIKKHWV